jgi:hypothetical protein
MAMLGHNSSMVPGVEPISEEKVNSLSYLVGDRLGGSLDSMDVGSSTTVDKLVTTGKGLGIL